MNKWLRAALLVLFAAGLFFVVGLATRIPAMRIGVNYGLHAVLAAFFYGALVSAFELRLGHAAYAALGAVVFGAILGAMSPVMFLSAFAAAVAYIVTFYAIRHLWTSNDGAKDETRAVVGGTVFAAFAYIGTIVGGVAFSGYTPTPFDLLFLLVSVGMGLVGSIVGTEIAKRLPRRA